MPAFLGRPAPLLFCLTALCCAQALPPTAGKHEAQWSQQLPDGREVERHFIVYVPESYAPEIAAPVVFMFHGTSGTGEKFYRISGWRQKADAVGCIAVFPTARKVRYHDDGKIKRLTKWNSYKMVDVIAQGEQLADDVAFVRAMLSQLEQSYSIDGRRVFASGFSNGAAFVSRLALEASDIISAVAIVGGSGYRAGIEPLRQIPVLQLVGEVDPKIVARRGAPLPMDSEELRSSELGLAMDGFIESFELADDYRVQADRRVTALHFETSTTDAHNRYIFAVARGLKHQYPNGRNHPLVGVDLFWEFFHGRAFGPGAE